MRQSRIRNLTPWLVALTLAIPWLGASVCSTGCVVPCEVKFGAGNMSAWGGRHHPVPLRGKAQPDDERSGAMRFQHMGQQVDKPVVAKLVKGGQVATIIIDGGYHPSRIEVVSGHADRRPLGSLQPYG